MTLSIYSVLFTSSAGQFITLQIEELCRVTFKSFSDLPHASLLQEMKSYGFKAAIIHVSMRVSREYGNFTTLIIDLFPG